MRFVVAGGVRVSAIGLGTWQFGAREWGYGEEYAERTAPALVSRALELGVNLIDTAELYGLGRSEAIVGKAIAGRRDEVFLATKVVPTIPIPPVIEWRAVESAARLGVEHLDLYQIHWPNPLVPLRLQMSAMAKLRQIGLIRHVGVSNFSLARWQEADRALGSPVLSNQVQYSLAVRRHGDELSRWAKENDRIVIAYSPLAQGLLSGRFDPAEHPALGAARATNPLFLPDNIERASELLEALREVASRHRATPSQVALAWLIRRPNVVAIPGASSIAQLEANVQAVELELTDDEDHRLSEVSARFHPRVDRAARIDLLRARFRHKCIHALVP